MSAETLNSLVLGNQNNQAAKYGGLDNTSIRTIEEVKGAIMVAKLCPRNEDMAVEKIMKACQRRTLAETALYEYERGGTPIEGPSIRLAEAAIMHWGNAQYGVRSIESSETETTYEVFAWDVENNVRASRVFTVEHVRVSKKGGRQKLEDPRDIYEVVMSQAARRLRACILEIIPGDVIDAAVEACKRTLLLNAGPTTKEERLQKMLEAFAEFGIGQAMIEKKYNCKLEAISESQIVRLRSIYQAIKDGFTKPENQFEFVPASHAADLNQKLQA